jgi:hypothetical protein
MEEDGLKLGACVQDDERRLSFIDALVMDNGASSLSKTYRLINQVASSFRT